MTPLGALLDELGILFADLLGITTDTFLEAAVALVKGPSIAIAVLSDFPSRIQNRIGNLPIQLLLRFSELVPVPKTRLSSRVVRADQVLAAIIHFTGEATADLTGAQWRGRINRGILLSEQKTLKDRIADRLGKRTLSKTESLVARLLKLLASPLRIFRLIYQTAVAGRNLVVAVTGGFFLLFFYKRLVSEEGQKVLERFCLPQNNPRVPIWEVTQGPQPFSARLPGEQAGLVFEGARDFTRSTRRFK